MSYGLQINNPSGIPRFTATSRVHKCVLTGYQVCNTGDWIAVTGMLANGTWLVVLEAGTTAVTYAMNTGGFNVYHTYGSGILIRYAIYKL